MTVIEVKQLTKVFKIPKKKPGLGGAVKGLFHPQFQNKTAVNEINFQLEAGEIVGYIGVNGAGKSTTIKMFGGLVTRLILQVPMAIVAVLMFGLRFPTDLSTWSLTIICSHNIRSPSIPKRSASC